MFRRGRHWLAVGVWLLCALASLARPVAGMNSKWKEWWANYDESKPPQYWQLPYAAAPSMKDYKSPSSPFPEPPPPTAQGFQGSGHFWPPPPMPPPSPPPPLPPPPTAPTKKSYQSAVPQVGGGSFSLSSGSGSGFLSPSWSASKPSLGMPPMPATAGQQQQQQQPTWRFRAKSASAAPPPPTSKPSTSSSARFQAMHSSVGSGGPGMQWEYFDANNPPPWMSPPGSIGIV